MLPIVAELRAVLQGQHRLALVVLFGSHAKGTARLDSDLDVAVLPIGAFSSADENELEALLSTATERVVDLVRLDRTDDVVVRKQIAGGAPLREATPGAFARFAAESALEWLDLEPVYRAAQARYLRHAARQGRP